MLSIPAEHEIMLIHVWFSPRDLEPNGLWKSIFFPIYFMYTVSWEWCVLILQRIIVRMHLYKLLSTFYICMFVCLCMQWSVGTILMGLYSFMQEETPTFGSTSASDAQRRKFAKDSLEFNLKNKYRPFPTHIHSYIHTFIHDIEVHTLWSIDNYHTYIHTQQVTYAPTLCIQPTHTYIHNNKVMKLMRSGLSVLLESSASCFPSWWSWRRTARRFRD